MIDYNKLFSLDKKLTFIVGSSGLIGSEIANAFNSFGSKLILLDIDKDKGIKLEKNLNKNISKSIFYEFDCSNLSNIENEIHKLIQKNGCPDIFVNCSYPRTSDWANSSFSRIKLKYLQENIDIHLNSYSWLAKVVAESMKKNFKKGSIIQLSSIYGIVAQDLNVYKKTKMHENMTYSIIKGGIISLTKQMASYYGKYGIRVNSISPGGIKGHIAGKKIKQSKTFIKNYSLKTPLGRLASPHEIATSALFLASEASSYITGSNLIVDGGWTSI